jgi:hypothetical protein
MRMTAMDTTWSSSPWSRMPRTPVESRPLNTRTSVVGKRIARPVVGDEEDVSSSEQMAR